ncbi:MAG TPA: hypothetical protein VJZ72_06880 [Candidatus Limnocylindrales bacterium]|nr:hypothetical protein [Candidatus Limnocylindrales bacterium]
MRIYDGAPRQDFEEVFRSMGAFLDQRGMREILLVEAPDGFMIQGLVVATGSGTWSDSLGQLVKETLAFQDDDIVRFMDEARSRRTGLGPANAQPAGQAGYYEKAFRVIGRYLDEQKPRDVFFFEQDGAFVVRMLSTTKSGSSHVLAEFTREDIEVMIAEGPRLRAPEQPAGTAAAKS